MFTVSARRKRDVSSDSSGTEVAAQTESSAEGALLIDQATVALEGDPLSDSTSQQVFENIYELMQGLCKNVIQSEPVVVVDHAVRNH